MEGFETTAEPRFLNYLYNMTTKSQMLVAFLIHHPDHISCYQSLFATKENKNNNK